MSDSTRPLDDMGETPWWMRRRRALGSYLTSGIAHLLLLLMMGLYILPGTGQEAVSLLIVDNVVEPAPQLDSASFSIVPHLPEVLPSEIPQDLSMPAEKIVEQPGNSGLAQDLDTLALAMEASQFLEGLPQLGEFGGRTDRGRAAMSRAFGGTAGSEAAVAAGLEWLKRHQHENGSWSFDHEGSRCDGSCTHAGQLKSATVGATAMALLCFVGAGHTHERGAYQPQVEQGLKFLLEEAEKGTRAGDLRQITSGNSGMYTQGLATIFLCELHGLTHDRQVGKVALNAMKFISDAQHPRTGGWRYQPGDEGDTSVAGWMIMAQTSARMSHLTVSSRSRKLAEKYLDSVQLENGTYYGYLSPQKTPSTTAIGLLCRMYQGRGKDHPGMKAGVAFLSERGPAADNMYYNYYATQVMRHWGGPEWKKWNEVMRELLVRSQDQEGHSRGSWVPRDPHGRTGGRHYMTCLAILTLEVYYRHLPLYQQQSVERGKAGGAEDQK